MTAERTGEQASLECPVCEARNPHHAGADLYTQCRRCGRDVRLVEPRRRWPALLLLLCASGLWAAAVLPWLGRDGSAETNLAATAIAWLIVRHFRRRWKDSGKSVKLLKSGARIFGIMLLFSIVFAAMSLFLRLLGPSSIAAATIGGILEMQAFLADWRLAAIVKAAGKWLLYGSAALAFALVLLNRPRDLARVGRGREAAGKLLSLAALILICFGSFSILAASSGAATVRLADDQVAAELRKVKESLARLEAQARIVVGEQLAAAMLEREPGSDSLSPTEALADNALRREQRVQVLSADPSAPDEPDGSAPSSPELARIVSAYQRAFRPAAAQPPPLDLARYARARPADVERALSRIEIRGRPSARSWAAPGFRDAVTIVVDLAMDGAGIRVPSVNVPKPLGAFFRKIVDTVTSKPANDALKARITDVALKYAGGETGPAAGDLTGLARPTRGALRDVDSHYRGRLDSAEARIASLTAPPAPPPSTTGTDTIVTTTDTVSTGSTGTDSRSPRADPNGACRCRWVRNGVPGPWFPCTCH